MCCSSELIFTFLYAGSNIRNARQQLVWFIHLCGETPTSSKPTNTNVTHQRRGKDNQIPLSRQQFNITYMSVPTSLPQNDLCYTYLLTYLLTPWCRVLLEQLTGLQLVKKFPAFHRTRRFITALTTVRHVSLSLQSKHPARECFLTKFFTRRGC